MSGDCIQGIEFEGDEPVLVEVHTGWGQDRYPDIPKDREDLAIECALSEKYPDFVVTWRESWYDNHGRGYGIIHRRSALQEVVLDPPEPAMYTDDWPREETYEVAKVSGTPASPYFLLHYVSIRALPKDWGKYVEQMRAAFERSGVEPPSAEEIIAKRSSRIRYEGAWLYNGWEKKMVQYGPQCPLPRADAAVEKIRNGS
jgi:hypothetical protein